MINALLALATFIFLFILLFLSLKAGYYFGTWRKKHSAHATLGVVKVAEGTVFALFGLLVAFSFSGAYDRFENRKIKIIEEVNSIETAYNYIDLLKPSLQADMRITIKQYLNERVATYNRMAEFRGLDVQLKRLEQTQHSVWDKSVAAVKETNEHATTLLFISSINNMFEVANTRLLITRVHPPALVFVLLFGLGVISSFLAGYNMSKNKVYNLFYVICFAGITAFTLYVITDLEFPRVGMIRVDAFDYFLIEFRDSLK